MSSYRTLEKRIWINAKRSLTSLHVDKRSGRCAHTDPFKLFAIQMHSVKIVQQNRSQLGEVMDYKLQSFYLKIINHDDEVSDTVTCGPRTSSLIRPTLKAEYTCTTRQLTLI